MANNTIDITDDTVIAKTNTNPNTKPVKLFPVDIVGDGRCFSGSAYYVLDNECKPNFNPRESEEDSKQLDVWIAELIITPIINKTKYDPQVVKWVHKYTKFKNTLVEIENLGPDESLTHPMDEFFEDKNLSILDGALERISQSVEFKGLVQVIIKLQNNREKEENLKNLLGVEINIENLSNLIKLLGVDTVVKKVGSLGNIINIKEEDINSTLGSLIALLGVNTIGNIDQDLIKKKIEEICYAISEKPPYTQYYLDYINYIQSLNQSPSYGWTEPNYGPAEVLAEAYNAIINLVPSDGNRNPLYKYPLAKPPLGNKTPKNVYIGMTMPDEASGIKGAGHFWAFVDGKRKTQRYELDIEKVKLNLNKNVNVNPTNVDDLVFMGFDKDLSQTALEKTKGNMYDALDLLIQQTNKINPRNDNLKILLELGFDETNSKDALKKHNNNVVPAADYLFFKQENEEPIDAKKKVNDARTHIKQSKITDTSTNKILNTTTTKTTADTTKTSPNVNVNVNINKTPADITKTSPNVNINKTTADTTTKTTPDININKTPADTIQVKRSAESQAIIKDNSIVKVKIQDLLNESDVKEVAVVLFVNNTDEVVFVRDKKDKKWMFPGGSKQDGESLLDAVNRKYKEETGSNLPNINFTYLQYHPYSDDDRDVIQIYIGKTKESCPSFKVNNITDKLECRHLSNIFEKNENTSDYKNYVIKSGMIIYRDMIKSKMISDDFVVGHTKNSPVSSSSKKPPSQNRSVTKKAMPPKVRYVKNSLENKLIMSAYNIEKDKHTPFSSNPKRDIALGTGAGLAVLAGLTFVGGRKETHTRKKKKRTGTRKHLRETHRSNKRRKVKKCYKTQKKRR